MEHPLDTLLGPVIPFVERIVSELEACGLIIDAPIAFDHLCFRTQSNEQYQALCQQLVSHGHPLVEGMIGARPIITYVLNEPIVTPTWSIPCLEVAAPKAGRYHQAGLEHIEWVVPSLHAIIADNPTLVFKTDNINNLRNPDIALLLNSGQVKFHTRALAQVIEQEIASGEVIPVPANYFNLPQA